MDYAFLKKLSFPFSIPFCSDKSQMMKISGKVEIHKRRAYNWPFKFTTRRP